MSRYVTTSEPGPAALGAVPQTAVLTTLFHPRLPARLSVERVAHEFPTMLSSRDADPLPTPDEGRAQIRPPVAASKVMASTGADPSS